MNSPRYFSPLLDGGEVEGASVCVCGGGDGGEGGVQYPQGRAAQIQGNKNASIFGRAFVSPDS